MPISLDYSLPPNRNLKDFIEAKFYHEVRKWWGFWNWGHPVPEITKQEVTKKNLKLAFNADKSIGKNLSSEEASLVFSRFCWEFNQFRENIALPHKKIMFCWDNFMSIEFGETLPRLMVLPQILENPNSKNLPDINDTSSVLRKAWNCLKRATPSLKEVKNLPSKITLDEAISHSNEISPLQIPALGKIDTYASEELELVFVEQRNSEIRKAPIIESESGKMWHVSTRANGILLAKEQPLLPESMKRHGTRLPVRIVRKEDIPINVKNTWDVILRNWRGEVNSQVNLSTEICRISELLEDYNLVYPVTRVDNHPKTPRKGHYIYRLDLSASHPIWGPINRLDSHQLVDNLYNVSELEAPEVTIGDPVPHSKDKVFRLIEVHDDDSELVLLKADSEPPLEGWLKPVDAGTRNLVRRKKRFQEYATRSRFLSRLLYSASKDMPEFWTEKTVRSGKLGLTTKAPLHLVIGPPGTGKTWTANNLVQNILEREPHARILVCAKEHFALNHLAMTIRDSFRRGKDHKVVRILPIHKEERAFVGDYKGLAKAKPEKVGKEMWKPRIKAGSQHSKFKDLWVDIESKISGLTAPWVSKSAIGEASVVCTTTTDFSLDDMLSEDEPPTFDYALIEEAGKTYPSELVAPMALSRQWVLIGDDRQLPPFNLQATSQNVEKILKLDYDTLDQNRNDPHIEVLFDNFRRGLLSETDHNEIVPWLQPFKKLKKYMEDCGMGIHSLNQQWRMEKDLSDIISQVFYETTFDHKKRERRWRQPRNRLLSGEFPLVWVDMPSAIENKKWAESGRYRNNEEAMVIKKIISKLAPKNLDVKILTPYNAQKSHLQKILGNFHDHVNTVDEFQGREADIVILSLVRNNKGTKVGRRWGFLTQSTRLNVMFSRAKQVLVVIGSLTHISDTEFYPDAIELKKVSEAFQSRARILTPNNVEREMRT